VSYFRENVIVTVLPCMFVEAFVVEYTGVHRLIGTKIEVDTNERAIGFVGKSQVLVGMNKKDVVKNLARDFMADVGMGKYKSAWRFPSLCKV